MTEKQLNKEYAKVMRKAQDAVGRKEGVGLLHKADSIRKKMQGSEKKYVMSYSYREDDHKST